MSKEKPKFEKMSKSRGNVVLPEEVVFGVADLDPKYEFRDRFGQVIDFREKGVWRDNFNTGFFFTATRFGRQPVWLCNKYVEDGPIDVVFLIDGEERLQHQPHKGEATKD